MIPFGGGQLNLNPCTPEDELKNLQILQSALTRLNAVIEAGGLPDHKVADNATDEANGGADYLHAKLHDAGTFLEDSCGLVRAETIADSTEKLFWDATDIPGFDPGEPLMVMALGFGTLAWTILGATVDNYTTKITLTDSVPGFFHDCIQETAAIIDGADLVVVGNVVGGAATDQKELFAVDVSAITDHPGSGFGLLGSEANLSKYFTITYIGSLLVLDSDFIDSLETVLVADFDIRYKQNLRKGRVTTPIPAATGPLTAQWGTTGMVDLQHATTGVLSGSPVAVDNDNIGTSWVVDAQVVVDTDYDPPRVLGGSCHAVSPWS